MTADSTELSPLLRARLEADPLWDFALRLYARPGVEAACLHLQDDAGLEVIELLWRGWLFRQGLAAGPLPEGIRRWQAEVTAPLRELRRALKAEARTRESVGTLRARIKAAELEAEREALARLERSSLAGERLLLSPSSSRLLDVLPFRAQLRKTSHFLALQTLEGRLDPSYPPG